MLSNLVELDLSNQIQGLMGKIPDDVSKLVHLSLLCLAGNKLDLSIPSAIGKLEHLKVLNLSSNVLSQSIPTELRRLQGRCRCCNIVLMSTCRHTLNFDCSVFLIQTLLKFWIYLTTSWRDGFRQN